MLNVREQCGFLRTLLCVVLLVGSMEAPAQRALQAKGAEVDRELVKSEIEQLLANAESLYRQKHYEESIPLLERALALTEKVFGSEDSKVGEPLFRLAVTYQQQGAFAKALPLFQRSLNLGEKLLGPEHDQIATLLVGVGMMQKEQGNFAQAIAAFTRSLAIVEKLSGKESAKAAATLNSFSSVYFAQGDYTKASLALQRSLAIREKLLGPEHPDVATCLNNLGELYRVQGNYLEASNALLRSLEIRVKAFGTLDGNVATTVNNAAVLQEEIGRHDAALGLHQRALEIREKVFGPTHPDVAVSLNNLGLLYANRAEFTRAMAAFRRSLAITEQIAGPEHPSVAPALVNLASVYRDQGDFREAEKLIRRSLSIRERAFGGEHPEVANSLNNLAFLYKDQGAYAQALPLLQRSLAIGERYSGPEHPAIAPTLDAIASVLESQGDYEKALPAYQRSLAISEKAFGPIHRQVAITLNNLAGLYGAEGKHDEALKIQNRSLAIDEKILGPDHPAVATALANLAGIHSMRGNPEIALPFARRSLELREEIFGTEHRDVAVSVGLIAGLKLGLGDEVEALRLYRRAAAIGEKTLGLEHPETRLWLTCVAIVCRRKGELLESEFEFARVAHSLRNYLNNQFSVASMGAVLRTLDALAFRDGLFHSAWAEDANKNVASAAPHGAEELALNKGLFEEVQVVQAALESSPQTATQEFLRQHQATRVELEHVLQSKLEPVQIDNRRRELQDGLSQIEAKLAERVALVGQTIQERSFTLVDVSRHLPSQAALVDIVKYRRFDFAAKTNQWNETRYAAHLTFPLAKDSTNVVVRRVDLGEAQPIDDAVELVARRMGAGQFRAADLAAALERLSRLVYAPLAPHLTNVSHLIVCPDGQLSRLPFEMLSPPSDFGATRPARVKYLIEEKTISYVGSGREVARLAAGPKSKVQGPKSGAVSKSLVMGNPDFDLDLGSARVPRAVADVSSATNGLEAGRFQQRAGSPRSFRSRELDARGMKFTPLPGSEQEARGVAKLLGEECVLRLGAEAREAELKAVQSPRVLHLATHGFFLSDQEFKRTNGLGDVTARRSLAPPQDDWENPLVRCGIALAGANRAKSELRMPNVEVEDGLLTGLEASLLNLQGTELVILSACDSGTGEVKIGEGVMSLRRAFRIAGAETVLASHWKVSDAATSRLMTEFMRRWRAGEPRAEAWRAAQLSLLHDKSDRDNPSNPYFWAAFTLTGQWR